MDIYYFNSLKDYAEFLKKIEMSDNVNVTAGHNGQQYYVIIENIVKRIVSKPTVRMIK